MSFMDDRTNARLNEKEVKRMEFIIQKNPQKYLSNSHFIRCAIINLLRQEEEKK